MTIHHPVRRLLQRFCSADTMASVVDPTLADMRWESGRPTLPGYFALAKALMVHSILSTPAVLSRTWSDDDRAIPKVAAFALAGGVVGVALQELVVFLDPYPIHREASVIAMALLLAPGALILSLPASLLLAIPLAFRRQAPSGRLARRTIALALACVVTTLVLVVWVMPETSHAFRVLASGQPLPRGPNEQPLAVIRERIEVLKLTPGGRVAARPLEFDYHVRFVAIYAPLPLGLLALAISRSAKGRRRPWGMGLAALSGYLFVFFPLMYGARLLMRWSSLTPVLFAWTPILLLTIIALRGYSSAPGVPSTEH